MAAFLSLRLELANESLDSSGSDSYLRSCSPGADNLFGPQVTVDCRRFDFTLLFEESFFSIAPSVALLIAATVRIYLLYSVPAKVAGDAGRNRKLAILVLFALLQLAILIASRLPGAASVKTNTSIASTTSSFIAACVLCLLSCIEHVKNIRSSDLISAYLFFSILLDIALARTLWLLQFDTLVASLFSCSPAVKALLLVLEARPKTRSYLKEADRLRGPEETSGIFNRSVFWFLNGLISQGFRKHLLLSDLYPLDDHLSSEHLLQSFQGAWHSSKSHDHRLIWATLKALKWQFINPVFPRLALLAFTFCQPLLIARLLDYLVEPNTDESGNIGWGLIGAYGIVYLGVAFSTGFYYHQLFRFITMVRGNLVTAVYHKTTEISITDLDQSAAITLMSADVERIVQGTRFVHELWANILSVGLATYLLQRELGIAAISPLLVAMIAGLGSLYASSKARSSQLGWLKKIQTRVDTTSIMLSSIKGVKQSGLTERFADTIQRLRLDEIASGTSFRMIQVITAVLAFAPGQLSPVVAFIAFTGFSRATGVTLDTSRLFTSISLTQVLATPLQQLFQVLPLMLAAKGCFERIQGYLLTESRSDVREEAHRKDRQRNRSKSLVADEIEMEYHNPLPLSADHSRHVGSMAVMVRNGSFGWTKTAPVLKDVTFDIHRSQLTLLIGPIASGKSTLLKALLGETPGSDGLVQLDTIDIAFCDQTPWLTNSSIRDSIIGCSELDDAWYGTVIHCCGLVDDLASFISGDSTLIGSSGIALSGGQRQRIAIARAVYSRKAIAIFDDVFSGFDHATEQIVFNRVFGSDGLLRRSGTTVILATHSTSFFQSANHILAIEHGKVVELEKTTQLAAITDSKHISTAPSTKSDDETRMLPRTSAQIIGARRSTETASSVEQQKTSHGSDLSVYSYYFGCLGVPQTVTLFFLQISYAFLDAFPSIWLSWWSDANDAHPDQDLVKYLSVYSALQILGLIALGLAAWQTLGRLIASSGAVLHKRILDTVVAAPISFFTTTDKGVTTNRFSQDIQIIDTELPQSLLNTVIVFFGTLASAGLVASSSHYASLAFPPIFIIFYFIQGYYLRTSRQLRILDLEAKSPLYTQFIDTLSGLATIRAFQWQESNHNLNKILLDRSQKLFYLLFMVQRWLTLVLDIVGAFLAVFVVTLSIKLSNTSSGFTGVALVNLITFTDNMKLGILYWTNLETSIGAVSRIRAFESQTPSETSECEIEVSPEDWPKAGDIKFQDVFACYKSGSHVLSNITLHIKAGEKVGICGRSGSGKSSLILALARMIEIESGTILIDSLDLSLVPREMVRSCLNIIPQDPFFLYGTIRLNLDPSGSIATPVIETALRRVALYDLVDSKGGLDVHLDETFLSHGQRQLFCLARALLRPSKILVLDEATSSVDSGTDVSMQRIIREEFKEHTVIAIAHRLETIRDFDHVVVLDEGKILECDAPQTLLGREGSAFKALLDINEAVRNEA